MGRNAIYKNSVVAENTIFPSFIEIGQMAMTFAIVTFSRIFFRADSITDAFNYIIYIIRDFRYESYVHPLGYRMTDYYVLIIVFVIYEYVIRKDERSPLKFKSQTVRYSVYSVLILTMLLFYDDTINQTFIYFQF